MPRRKPTFLSLFCGCGGFDLGFQNAGYRGLGAYDVDDAAIEAYRSNLPFPAYLSDLSIASFEQRANCDVVLAGPPCQGFSTIGRRRFKDPRNDLLLVAARLAASINPKVIVLENVAGVIAGKHAIYWTRAKSILRKAGYKIEQLICNADAHGLPQIRKRILLIAWRSGFEGPIALPKREQCSIRSILYSLPATIENHAPLELSSSCADGLIAKRIAPGQKLSNVRISERTIHTWDIPEVFGRTTKAEREVLESLILRRRQRRTRKTGDGDPVSALELANYMRKPVALVLAKLLAKGYVRKVGARFDFKHTFNGKYRRLQWDSPSPTVDTKFGDPRYFLHPEENRAFTVREAARVQGFPDTFIFEGTKAHQYKMIANAVPPTLSEIIAIKLLELI